MAKWWTAILFTMGGLALTAPAHAQPGLPPVAPPPPGCSPFAPPAPDISMPAAPVDPSLVPENAFTAPCDECCPGLPHQPSVEYLGWFTPRMRIPPLVTTGVLTDPIPGAIGQPGTTVVVADPQLKAPYQSGVRLSYGADLGCDSCWSWDVSGFILDGHKQTLGLSGDGATGPVLALPFFDTVLGVENAAVIAAPGVASGRILIQDSSLFYGADADLRWTYWNDESSRIVFMAGARYLALSEALRTRTSTTTLPAPGVTTVMSQDFTTHNDFYGAQVGADYEYRFGPLTADLLGKVAVGPERERVYVAGATSVTDATGAVTLTNNSALYVSPNNAGTFHHTVGIAVAPEIGAKVGYDFNEYIRLTVGYSAIYLSDAVRPGDQVNRNVAFPAGGVNTTAPFTRSTDFWAQGFDVGLVFHF